MDPWKRVLPKSFAKRVPGSGAPRDKLARFSTKVGSNATSPLSTAQATGPNPGLELRKLFLSEAEQKSLISVGGLGEVSGILQGYYASNQYHW